MENLVKQVKSVNTATYTVTLVEALSGGYYIIHGSNDKVETSLRIPDYSVASFLFDIRMRELEGH